MIAAPPPSASNAASASPAMTAGMDSSHQAASAYLTARKFAEFLQHQQHQQQQQQQQQQRQKELNETTSPTTTAATDISQIIVCPKKRQRQEIRQSFGDTEEDEDEEGITKLEDEAKLLPLELLRARWEGRAESPSADSAGGSSTGSSNEIGLGREVKKRRLDELLSKKFSVADSPPNSASAASSISPPPVVSSSTPQKQQQQQPSTENSVKKVNRRKPSSPVSSLAFAHPATSTSSILSVRPPSELFAKNDRQIQPRPSPVPRRPNSKSPHRQQHQQQQQHQQIYVNNIKQEENESELLKGQLMQLQLAQAALLSGAVASSTSSPTGSAFPGLAGLSGSGNPLLYYGYYAQMLQGLQAQQQKLLEQLASQKQRFISSPNSNSTATKLLMASPSHLLSANDPHKRNVSFVYES